MLNNLKSLKNNNYGYVMVYIIMLMAFITILFAGTAMALNGRNTVTKKTLSNKQLQITAQSALNTIVEEFENNADLKSRLKSYADGNQSAEFELTNETGISDDIKVDIANEPGMVNKARITVTASNDDGSISTAFALIDYSEPPKSESAGVTDNLIVAFLPNDFNYSGNYNPQYMLCKSDEDILERIVEGTIVVNNYGKKPLTVKNQNKLSSIIASGDIICKNGEIRAVDENADEMLASTNGTVTMDNQAAIKGNGINLLAGYAGYSQKTDNFVWDNPNVKIVTGDKGNVSIKALVGTIGSITSGGKIDVKVHGTGDLTVTDGITSTKDIVWDEDGPNYKTTIGGDIIGGEDITFNSKHSKVEINGDMAAVGHISGKGGTGSQDDLNLYVNNIYAGRSVAFENVDNMSVNTILSGANYRNGDSDSTASYLNSDTNKGSVLIKGVQWGNVPNIASVVINDANGSKKDIKGYEHSDKVHCRNNDDGFTDKFYSANSNWRNHLLKVETGADSKGVINLAVALRPNEVDSANKLAAFTNSMEPAAGYYEKADGTLVSHHSKYTVNNSKHILNNEIKTTFEKVNQKFKNSIPDMNLIPTVKTPASVLSDYASVSLNGSDLTVHRGGYMRISNGRIYARNADNGDEYEAAGFELNQGGNICFDTSNGRAYDIAIGTEEDRYNTYSDNINFNWNICVNQPEENMGYVRFFFNENADVTFGCGSVKNTANASLMPEVYFFSNGSKMFSIRQDNRYYLNGYIIMPHGLVNLFWNKKQDATNKGYEGLIICGNVGLPGSEGGRRLAYHKPVTDGITTDVYMYE